MPDVPPVITTTQSHHAPPSGRKIAIDLDTYGCQALAATRTKQSRCRWLNVGYAHGRVFRFETTTQLTKEEAEAAMMQANQTETAYKPPNTRQGAGRPRCQLMGVADPWQRSFFD
jgi:hypothetical protein